MADQTASSNTEAAALIRQLGLQPHPEGGHFTETFRSVLPVHTGDARGARTALTAIHFLLAAGEHSRWHRVTSDEVWHWAAGGPMELMLMSPALDETLHVTLGALDDGHTPMHVVPAGWWQAARPLEAYALCSCVVGPGFDFADFAFMDQPEDQTTVRTRFPDLAAFI